MDTALSDSEIRVMDVVWDNGGQASAKLIAETLNVRIEYSASATYTLIHRCIKKGALERIQPGFICRALVSREDVQAEETDRLVDRVFNGSADKLFAAFIGRKKVSREEIARLRSLVDDMAQEDDNR